VRETVNKEMCVDILRRLGMESERNFPTKLGSVCWFLLHDNTSAHRSVLLKSFLVKSSVTTLEHPLYSSDLAPAAFYLFP
jgi:hypothetical protein